MSGFFYGWYLKCQSDTQTLAVIPAVHNAGRKRTCSIQVITDNDAWTVTFHADSFRRTRKNIFIGDNRFGEKGIKLAIHTPQLSIKGKEYRMATYLGARAVQIQNNMVRVIQGNLELEARLLEASERLLKAPTKGVMVRTIHESASCRAFYRFCKKGCTLFAFKTDRASFEFEYSESKVYNVVS